MPADPAQQRENQRNSLLPAGMNVDPQSYGVVYVLEQMKEADSSFQFVGHARGATRSKETRR